MTTTPEPDRADSIFDVARLLRVAGLFVVAGVVTVVALATLPGIGEVRERIAAAQPAWIGVAAGCSLCSMLGFVAALWGAFERKIPRRVAVDLGFAEQGANVLLPAGGTGGPALGALLMSRAGVPGDLAAERHAALFLVTSAVGLAALVVFGVTEATGLLPGHKSNSLTLLPAGLGFAGIAISLLFARTAVPPEPRGGRVRHTLWRLRRFLHGGVRTTIALLRRGDPLFVLGAVAYFAFDVAALAATFEAFGGGGPPLSVFVLAYAMGHAGALIPTPGGVGGADGGLIGSFVLYGAPLGLAATAVFGYRVFQLGLPIVLGGAGLLRLRARYDGTQRAAIAARYREIR